MVHDRRLPTPLLWNVRIVDRPPREQATVEIEDGRIITIGDARGDPPAGALDCGGRTVCVESNSVVVPRTLPPKRCVDS